MLIAYISAWRMKDTSCGSWWIQSLALWRHQKSQWQDNVLKSSDWWPEFGPVWPAQIALLCRLVPNGFVMFYWQCDICRQAVSPSEFPWHRWLFNWQHVMRLVRSWNQQLLWHALLSDKWNWFLRGMMMSIFLGSQRHPVFCWLAIAVGRMRRRNKISERAHATHSLLDKSDIMLE